MRGRGAVEAHQRRVADGLGDVVVYAWHGLVLLVGMKSAGVVLPPVRILPPDETRTKRRADRRKAEAGQERVLGAWGGHQRLAA